MITNNPITLSKLHVASADATKGLQKNEMRVRTPVPCTQKNASGSLGAVKGLRSFREEARRLGQAYAKALVS